MQALEAILKGPGSGAVLPTLLLRLPRHSAAILRHAQLDPSCKLCNCIEDSVSDAEEALAVLHAFHSMAEAASHSQLQELLLRLLQLAACEWRCHRVAEGAALAINSLCHKGTSFRKGSR
jgi:hypothetical protein